MAEVIGEFNSVSELLLSDESLQFACLTLLVGIITIILVYRKFSNWILTRKFSYTRSHLSNFVRSVLLPIFALILITAVNGYVQITGIFLDDQQGIDTPQQIFAKILNSLNLVIIGYTTSYLIPIVIRKQNASNEEKQDFIIWKEKRGFGDDDNDFFHTIYKWQPPKEPPEDMDKAEFKRLLETKEGRKTLEKFRTNKGFEIGTLVPLVKDPFETWKKSEREKYEKYYQDCTSGNNQVGQKLRPGAEPNEIFSIDQWRSEKRLRYYDPIKPGARPAGYSEKQKELMPKSLTSFIPPLIFSGFLIGLLVWWNVDLFVLGTALAGLGVGIGFALKETLENLFAYLMIRKDKVFVEGDRVLIEDYNGYVHKITTRITYIRHALNESIAIFPTRQMVGTKVVNFSKDYGYVPALIKIGTSYLNDPQQVCSILVKVGKRAMKEIVDENGRHLAVQERCPYLDKNKPSCGCDHEIVDVTQPWVLFDDFGDSALMFEMWIYVRDYGSQFKMKSNLRLMIYQEFKKHDIRIPWPIRTIYSGNQIREEKEIEKLDELRKKTYDEYGPGEMNKF
ncbi:mechanosensitive ion channel domain-containing protein [Nitrosopumilus sp.]|uniref:mechanosensitive ion channel family protein n=1 Tax=Nitrosopumilus sp. TaxID=2024843 RepID=UPI00247DFE8E|nr:mechanosensitive ion channel domain-containing protein [Nitrosopumilus sp.]MCV0411339.1 mechanosensitive ion channel [Nitrosopumilus sp.]